MAENSYLVLYWSFFPALSDVDIDLINIDWLEIIENILTQEKLQILSTKC